MAARLRCQPSYEPSTEIFGLGCADMARMRDLVATLSFEAIEF
jgi:hypothetical protein